MANHPVLLAVFLTLSLAGDVAAAAMGAATATTTTHLRFYMHDTVTAAGPSSPATAVLVARGAAAAPLPGDPVNRFGDLYVIDDPLTAGPDAASAAVGRAQGFYLYASRSEPALLLSATMAFTAGPHRGGAVSVLARDAFLDAVRELPVVGGAGALRGAAGYGLLRTHSSNATTNNAVLQIDMYLSV